jgi:hypothetical protein
MNFTILLSNFTGAWTKATENKIKPSKWKPLRTKYIEKFGFPTNASFGERIYFN